MAPRGRPRSTHCPQGHELTDENTYVGSDGRRRCRECRRQREGVTIQPGSEQIVSLLNGASAEVRAEVLANLMPRCPKGHQYDLCRTCELERKRQPSKNPRPKSDTDKCGEGHEFTPQNTYWRPNGTRECVECGRIRKGYKPRNPADS